MKRFLTPNAIIFIGIMVFMAMRNNTYAAPIDWLMAKLMILPGIIIGLSFHEFAHAFVADKLGDPTPRQQGRITINPISHIDPIGMVALLFVGFGWGVPVQINPMNFKKQRRDQILVSIAGVTMNLILAIIFTLLIKIVFSIVGLEWMAMSGILFKVFLNVVIINIVLMIFNLLPIPPLDGFNIITEIFDLKRYSWWSTVYNNGFIILIALILLDFTGYILTPAVDFVLGLLRVML